MLTIFADHCIPKDIVEAIRNVGIKVVRAYDVSLHKASDEEIFSFVQQKGYVLLTFAHDFGNIIRFDIIDSKGIVIVLIERLDKIGIIKRTVEFFQKATGRILLGRLFTIGPTGIETWPHKLKN